MLGARFHQPFALAYELQIVPHKHNGSFFRDRYIARAQRILYAFWSCLTQTKLSHQHWVEHLSYPALSLPVKPPTEHLE